MTTTITRDGAVAVLRFDEGRSNALSFNSIDVLMRALDDVEKSDAHALVVIGRGKPPDKGIFCAGLDLREITRLDRPSFPRFVDAFEGLFERLFAFPLPVVAALNGHAIAGGAVIAFACDLRVIAPAAEIGLNEVELGIPFPSMAFEIGRFSLPAPMHVEGLMLGRRFPAEEAVQRDIVHYLARDVEGASLARAKELTLRGHSAVMATKRMLRAEALSRARKNAAQSRSAFVDAFFSEEAQSRIRPLVSKLERR